MHILSRLISVRPSALQIHHQRDILLLILAQLIVIYTVLVVGICLPATGLQIIEKQVVRK